jgi:hypothetical protein
VTAWILIVSVGAANIAGYAFDLYRHFWWFDRVLHGCTILAVTLWLAIFVFNRVFNGEHSHRILTVLLLASLGIALGAVWEVVEWGFDQVAPGDVIKGKYDTLLDIVMDTAGAVLAGITAVKLARSPR